MNEYRFTNKPVLYLLVYSLSMENLKTPDLDPVHPPPKVQYRTVQYGVTEVQYIYNLIVGV